MTSNLFLINQNFSADSVAKAVTNSTSQDSLHQVIQGSFLHTGGKLFDAQHPVLSVDYTALHGQYWIFYLLFGLIALFAFIRYYFSSDLRSLMSSLRKNMSRQENDGSSKAGFIVPIFLFINFFISMGILLMAVNQEFHLINAANISVFNFFLFSGALVLGYYLFNEFTILLVGLLFGTSKQALLHAKTGSYLIYILGILLTPLLLFYFFTGLDFLLYISGVLIVVATVFKWILLLRNSYSLNHYTPFHIILYLCGLEIIPIMLLIKVGMIYA
ncbi:MAG: DUF4271 domain-containing protein [Bacteroidales bacterium]|nr:DUF4271 domain-containing protein [Bacteroidales bacterium]